MNNKKRISAEELSEQVQTALQLLESDAADEIIGEEPAEHSVLIKGAQALMSMHWLIMKQEHGLRESGRALQHQAQTLLMVLKLVHIAYALGCARGASDG